MNTSQDTNQDTNMEHIKEIQPIDTRFTINLLTTTKPTKQTEQQHRQALETKSKDNTQSLSTAFLCPILEDNELKCPHNGRVKLKSNKGKSFTSKDIP
ncbi:hypothetical protein CQA53_09990, partial [Helicobacter didelphidarum]